MRCKIAHVFIEQAVKPHLRINRLGHCTEMVNIDIPLNYTASPSSFSGTPHLIINRDVTVDLDSTNAFEGMPNTSVP